MKKIAVLIIIVLFSFGSLFAQGESSKAELDGLKRDVDSLKNELEVLKLKKDMEKLQGELDNLKASTPKSETTVPSVSNISAPTNALPFKRKVFTLNTYSGFAAILAALADNQYYMMKDEYSGYFSHVIPKTTSLDYYGVNLNSEYFVTRNVSLTFEYGWNGGSMYFADSSKSELKADFDIIPLAVGFKVYPKRYSPYGFFMNPKVGATIIRASGSIISRNQPESDPDYKSSSHHWGKDKNDRNFYYDSSLASETSAIKIDYDYGIYAGVEFGFRIPLFKKALSKKKVELGIDVSLLDIGYYIKPYHGNIASQLTKMPILNGISEYSDYLRWRVLPLSKIGFTLIF